MHVILSSSAVVIELPGAEGEKKSCACVGLGSSLRSNLAGEAGEELGSAVVLAPVPRTSIVREVILSLEISGEEGDVRKRRCEKERHN